MADGFGEGGEDGEGLFPAQAGVGDAAAVDERAGVLGLGAAEQVAFEHGGDDGAFAGGDLGGEVGGDEGLAEGVLAAVGVRAVDHEVGREAVVPEQVGGAAHVVGGVVGSERAAAEDEVGVFVAGGAHDGGGAFAGERGEPVGVAGGADGVDRDLEVAVGAVLETDGHGEAGGEFAVDLALDGARADRAPRDEVGVVLAEGGIEELGGDGQAEVDDAEHEPAREAEAGIDLVALVEERIVDQAFPADDGARFLEVNAHDGQQFAGVERRGLAQAFGVLEGGGGIVDGTRADDDEQARIGAGENRGDLGARAGDEGGGGGRQRQFLLEDGGREQRLLGADAEIEGLRGSHPEGNGGGPRAEGRARAAGKGSGPGAARIRARRRLG